METYIAEASKYQKKYKCPYCDVRLVRTDLVDHINEKHPDMIPKGFTATRVVFNLINKKDHGTCVICKGESDWDENKARYNRLCNKKSCRDKYVKIAHTNTKIEERLRDPEFQQKMLAGRSISGEYKFSDGGKVSYTGSYEKKLLEFLDNFLHVQSCDIQSPGPVIEYEYNGQTHKWITDQYYIPYNLVFDVKDGGSNPNRREMVSYREKQIAKEAAIKKQGKYNYIRLTDNNFQQLIEIMLELKESLTDNLSPKTKPIIRINENSSITIGALPPANPQDVYLVHYMKKNTFIDDEDAEGYALSKSFLQDCINIKHGLYEMFSFEELKEMDLEVYRYTGEADFVKTLMKAYDDTDFYTILAGKELLDPGQIRFSEDFKEELPYTDMIKILSESIVATIEVAVSQPDYSHMLYEGVSVPIFEMENLNESHDLVKIYRDMNGYFMMNEDTWLRTPSYDNYDKLVKFKSEISTILR